MIDEPIYIKFLHSPTDQDAINSTKILKKYEILRIYDSGKFKVGDGISKFADLKYTDILPEEMYFKDFDGVVEYKQRND